MAGNLLPYGWDPTSTNQNLDPYTLLDIPAEAIHLSRYFIHRLALGHGSYASADVVSESGAALELRISGSEWIVRRWMFMGSAMAVKEKNQLLAFRARSNSGEVTKTRRLSTASFFGFVSTISFLFRSRVFLEEWRGPFRGPRDKYLSLERETNSRLLNNAAIETELNWHGSDHGSGLRM
ncbi:hypothetical protein C8Q75DRAFT_732305 [Abortiporus biennis]|nr:hypothetical protein C8Q75DRAFT_732305 [Abortiporus biennis]